MSTYQGPAGETTLQIRLIGEENIEYALSELPQTATEVGYDDALGPRNGLFFNFADEFHAAWGNGDWIFILSASSADARRAFLASYGF